MGKNYFLTRAFLMSLLCASSFLKAFDPWSIGVMIAKPFWEIFAKKTYDQETKKEEDRLNESIDRALAIIQSPDIPEDQKTVAKNQLARDQKAKQCNDIKIYLKSIEQNPENKSLIEEFEQQFQECAKKVLQMTKNVL